MKLPSLIEIPNGDKVTPTFSDAEMQGRLARLRDYMAAERRRGGGADLLPQHQLLQ